ncbi:reticulon-1-A isoform X5 [Oncorhynchus tshawytscha]|uniref:reticulon-1-A isoform X5 n=1 Tax=Oncorhynchus tshawytscha TaxID=74940 RepID=UPI000D09B458|nr:reticulon-1-A isoform X5 [Oncorhynchus tshawytscha]
MEDSEQVVSSTTPSEDEMRSYRQFENHYGNEATAKVGKDDIVDLVGGAQDAIERHMASYPDDSKEFTEEAKEQLTNEVISDITPSDEEQEEEATDTFSEAEPVILNPLDADYLPELIRPDPPKAAQEKEPAPVVESAPVAEVLPEAAPEKEAIAAPPAPSLVELLYWRDVKTSGVVFGASLSLLLSLTLCSIVSVSSYIGLALLSVTICFRIYKGILQAIQKSDEGHPFKLYLDQDVALSEGTVHKYSDCVLARFNTTVTELRRLFLVEDLVDSLKFAVLMWILTYVGALFNGLTLFILGLVGMFSCPIVYEKYKVQIDHYVGMASKQVKDIIATVQSKVPGLTRVKAE